MRSQCLRGLLHLSIPGCTTADATLHHQVEHTCEVHSMEECQQCGSLFYTRPITTVTLQQQIRTFHCPDRAVANTADESVLSEMATSQARTSRALDVWGNSSALSFMGMQTENGSMQIAFCRVQAQASHAYYRLCHCTLAPVTAQNHVVPASTCCTSAIDDGFTAVLSPVLHIHQSGDKDQVNRLSQRFQRCECVCSRLATGIMLPVVFCGMCMVFKTVGSG